MGRRRTFFGEGLVGHVAFGEPTCSILADAVEDALKDCSLEYTRGGTYICIEGPQFSTRAESELFRTWNASVIGMTNMPEARFAREAELPYTTLAMVTDYDCWHDGHDAVTVEQVIATLKANAQKALSLIAALGKRSS